MDYKNILIVPKNHFIFLISAIKLKKNMSFKIIFLVQFLLLTSISFAQETAKEYQEVKEKYNSKVFTYTIDPEEADKQPQNSDWAQGLLKIITSIRWDYLLYLIIGLVVLLILYKLYNNGMIFQYRKEYKTNENITHFDYIENNLLTIDLVKLINNAKKDQNYRLAIRYYHYQNTQNLALKNYFNWDPKKTNQQLSYLIKDQRIKEIFEHNTTIFNQIWFGEFEINETNFKTFETNFNYLNEIL